MWRDFPRQFCEAGDFRGLVFSRYGYGGSTPRPHAEKWGVDFMHRQAREAVPALFEALDIGPGRRHGKPWLLGHSDGGSIALIHAASFPDAVDGLTVLAPHIIVEDLSVRSIAVTRETYLQTDLRDRLARHHHDVDSAFWGGTTSGSTPISAALTYARCCTTSAARRWRYRARTTSTARWSKSRVSSDMRRKRCCLNSRGVDIRRTGTSPAH
jgi:pimeloyl-ACP methyl ester carboxylesterase